MCPPRFFCACVCVCVCVFFWVSCPVRAPCLPASSQVPKQAAVCFPLSAWGILRVSPKKEKRILYSLYRVRTVSLNLIVPDSSVAHAACLCLVFFPGLLCCSPSCSVRPVSSSSPKCSRVPVFQCSSVRVSFPFPRFWPRCSRVWLRPRRLVQYTLSFKSPGRTGRLRSCGRLGRPSDNRAAAAAVCTLHWQ